MNLPRQRKRRCDSCGAAYTLHRGPSTTYATDYVGPPPEDDDVDANQSRTCSDCDDGHRAFTAHIGRSEMHVRYSQERAKLRKKERSRAA